MFSFYNTKSRKIEHWTKSKDIPIHIYCCGPTVYAPAHIGNMRLYVFLDIFRRILKLSQYSLNMAMNITDIDDKIIQQVYDSANIENPNEQKFPPKIKMDLKDLKQFTKIYQEKFFADIIQLGIQKIEHYPIATESIETMIELIEKLIQKGYAYDKDGSIYFSIKKFQQYGQLSQIHFKDKIENIIQNETDDFVLWKKKKNQDIAFASPFGEGRPGWHLECSAMIQKTFGSPINFHIGGVDLIFPHHENEIAQSQCGYEHSFVDYWIHCEHLLVDANKMSKSEGNFYILDDIIQKGFHPIALRYLLFSVHYRQKLNFTFGSLEQIHNSLQKILKTYASVKDIAISNQANSQENLLNDMKEVIEKQKEEFFTACNTDFNLPKGLSYFHSFITYINSKINIISSPQIKKYILESFDYFDSVLNIIDTYQEKNSKERFPNKVIELVEKRKQARLEKDYVEADNIRKTLQDIGYHVEDKKDGSYIISKIK